MSTVEQSRKLVTEIPGPKSQELTKRRVSAVSRGVGVTMPVYCARAFGGIIEDVDGNRLIDLGSGIAVTTIGSSARGLSTRCASRSANSPHLLHGHPYEVYIEVAEHLNRLTPGPTRSEPRCSIPAPGGGERDQDRPRLHPAPGGGLFRSRLPRSHQPHDGTDRQVDALQEWLRAVCPGGLPGTAVLPLPRRPHQ